MEHRSLIKGLLVLASAASPLAALADATGLIGLTSVDAGGVRAASANYVMDSSIGGIGGVSSNVSPAETLKCGYIGQLTEVTNLLVIASPEVTNEGGVLQLTGLAELDDATVSALAGSNIVWAAPGLPVTSITVAGAATAAAVRSNTWGVVTGAYLGISDSVLVLVLDSDPDNYGIYGRDQVSDAWQLRYFGTDNPLGTASATNCTGQSNFYTYTADLDPNNPASTFEIVAISNQPANRLVCFRTASTGRVYRLMYATDLANGVWTNLPGSTWTPGLTGQMSLSDTNTATRRFYRISVQVP